ncbi:class I SAM-dependent methyltransferase [Frateuria aurantia]
MSGSRSLTVDDTVQQALLHALGHGVPAAAEGRTLVLRGVPGKGLEVGRHWDWLQTFRPHADALVAAGLTVLEEEPQAASYARILVLAPRQRDEARAAMARALDWLAPGGCLLVAAANNEGARSTMSDLEALAGLDGELSKHKCRVGWAVPVAGRIHAGLRAEWSAMDAVRCGPAGYFTRPGLFAWDRLDTASSLLAGHLPATLSGRMADLGAGYGYLSGHLLRHCPGIKSLDLYEAEARALPAARMNLQRVVAETGRDVPLRLMWSDVGRGLDGRYEVIVSNPPFHLGRADVPALGQAFIRAAAAALVASGQLWLVANRHLPYEVLLRHHFGEVETVADATGFKVIRAASVRAR